MPWRTSDLLQQREDFVKRAEADDANFSSLCRAFGISRNTGYKWVSRYQNAGKSRDVLKDKSRRPHNSPRRVGADVAEHILSLYAEHACPAEKLSVALEQLGITVGRSTVFRILEEHGRITREDPNAATWISQVFVAADPLPTIKKDIPAVTTPGPFADLLQHGRLRDRKKAITVLARLKGISPHTIAESLNLSPRTVVRYARAFAGGGVDALVGKRKSKVNDEAHRAPVFALLHSPPSSYDINRTTWKMKDLCRILAQKGHRISEARVRRIIKSGGYRWRRAKTVLTSNDPEYGTKLESIKSILSELKSDEAFFSIDEYGPFAVKQKGGTKRVGPAEQYVVPQWQKSKGWMILTAALELSRNQVTHFYSRRKNTEEMIRMADLLRCQYRECCSIYLSWDAASWHISRKLLAHLEKVNDEAANEGYPIVKTAPLPAGAQFLNVIESVFSGMARAIIHNSDYVSLGAAKNAIDRYFRERNEHFSANPRRAGGKIWGKERVPSEFQEGQNCKDPAYR